MTRGPSGSARPSPREATLGRWRLEAKLGEGATSTVWSATDASLRVRVALKILKTEDIDEQVAQRRQLRMMRESEALLRSAHPNVVRIVEIGRVGTRVYLAMELIDGVDLRAWLETPRSWPEIVSVFLQCASGLAAAHRAGIIHRDFKPANVMVARDGRAVVTDFGLARGETGEMETGALAVKLTAGGVAVGTPRYMAPEQHQAGPTDARTDQFALGIAMFEALFGLHPYAPEPRQDVAPSVAYALATLSGRIVAATEPRERLPAGLEAVVRRALEPAPSDRFPDLETLIRALEDVVAGAVRKKKVIFGATLAGGIALAFVAAAVTVGVLSSSPAVCRGPPGALDGSAWLARSDLPAGARERAEAALTSWSSWWADAVVQSCRGAQVPEAEERLACLARAREANVALLAEAARSPALAGLAAVSAALGEPCASGRRPFDAAAATDVAAAVHAVSRTPSPDAWLALLRALHAAATRDLESGSVTVAEDATVADARARAERREAIGLVLLGYDRRKPATEHLARAHADAVLAKAPDLAARILGALTEAELAGAASDAALGDLAGAEARVTAILERLERAGGGVTATARALEARAWVRGARGHHQAALADAREAVSRAREALGEAHPAAVSALFALGALEAGSGSVDAAIPRLEEAARRQTGPRRAEIWFMLARALGGRDPARARQLALDARKTADLDVALARALDEWIARPP